MTKLLTQDNLARGVGLMVIGWGLITVNDALMKALTGGFPLGQVLGIRGLFVIIPVLWLVRRAGGWHSLRTRNPAAQLLSATLLTASTFMFIGSLRYLPLADATAITLAAPVIVTAIAPWFLGERVGWRRRAAVAIGFVGVLIMLRPGMDGFRWATLLPFGAACAGAWRDVLTRRMVRTETSESIFAYSSAMVVPIGLATIPFDAAPMGFVDVAWLAVAACIMGLGQFMQADAFRYAEASVIAPFRYTNLLWAMLLGALIFGHWPDAFTLIGAGLVVGSGAYIVNREQRLRRSE